RIDFAPVAVLLVDVGTGCLAARALRALRVWRLVQAIRFGVDLLDERERTDIVAPGFPRVEDAGEQGGEGDEYEEGGDGSAASVGGDQADPEGKEEDREADVVGVRLKPGRSTPRAGAPEEGWNLTEEGERADATPAMVTREHD